MKTIVLNHESEDIDIKKKFMLDLILIIVSIGACTISIIGALLFIFEVDIGIPAGQVPFFVVGTISVIIFFVLWILNKYIPYYMVGIAFVVALWILVIFSDTPGDLVGGRGLLTLAIPVIISGTVTKPWMSLVMAAINGIFISILALSIGELPNVPGIIIIFIMGAITWITLKKLEKSFIYAKRAAASSIDAINKINLYKDIFSHDISNFLQNMRGILEIMHLEQEPSTVLIEKAHQQVHRAAFLVDNIRNLEKVDALDPVLDSKDAIPIIKEKIDQINQMMEKFAHRKVTIHEQLHVKKMFVRGDEMLGVVFENILNNTIVHNRNESVEIIVRSRDTRLNGRPAVIFEILDNGIGVPDQLKHEIFSRGVSKGRFLSGTGIGLLLATKIIELYGGKITVDDRIKGEPSKGTKFSIILHAFGE